MDLAGTLAQLASLATYIVAQILHLFIAIFAFLASIAQALLRILS